MRSSLVLLTLFFVQSVFALGTEPKNFFQVDSQVLRGAAVTQDNVAWLSEHGVKAIVKLDDENPDEASWGIPVENYHINKFGLNLSYNYVHQILTAI